MCWVPDQVVPVLLGALPLREDYDEAEAVYGALAGLLLDPATAARAAPSLGPILQARRGPCRFSCTPDTPLHTALVPPHFSRGY
jgi:hypothetical protein